MKRFLFFLLLSALILHCPHPTSAQTPPAPAVATPALPASFVTATDTLFADGMADPRGGTYRAITVHVGSVWGGDGGVIDIHGWVLPSPGRAGVKRAVAWNGLTYDVIANTGSANLKADVDRLFPDVKTTSAKQNENTNDDELFRELKASEALCIDGTTRRPLMACMLLCVGESALAQRAYSACMDGKSLITQNNPEDRKNPFRRLAVDWAWSAFDRAVCAHMRGDDRLCLDDATFLTVAGPKLIAQSVQRGVPPQPQADLVSKNNFDFLKQAPALLADSRRRIADSEGAPDAGQTRATHQNAPGRIALLIRQLDTVAVRQQSQPGGINLETDPACQAIIAEGEAAIDPLLNTMETDKRLTRSVSFWRDFAHFRNLLTVRSAASVCILHILHIGESDGVDPNSVPSLRKYWNAHRNMSLADRLYDTLADDRASPQQWLEAAGSIVQSSNADVRDEWGNTLYKNPGSSPARMLGESLRTHHTPTVSALLARRVAEIAGASRIPDGPNGEFTHFRSYESADGISLGLMLADWDLKASRPTLKLLMHRLRRVHFDIETIYGFDQVGECVAWLTVARIKAGDPEAEGDYAAIVRKIPPSQLTFRSETIFLPLYSFPKDTMLAPVADALFNKPHSAWNPVVAPADSAASPSVDHDDLIASPLLCVPAFRRQVLRELDDSRRAGTATINRQKDWIEVNHHGGGWVYGGINFDGPLCARDGQSFPIRMCDFYAFQLVRATPIKGEKLGMPRFELYWPQPRRDRAIKALKPFLLRYGEYFTLLSDPTPFHDVNSRTEFGLRPPPVK